jgi:hypothetical protein
MKSCQAIFISGQGTYFDSIGGDPIGTLLNDINQGCQNGCDVLNLCSSSH